MYQLIYVSSAIELMTDEGLKKILHSSRKNNTAKNVTGMLLYGEGTFLQLLEGDEKDVTDIYAIIERDPRHVNLIKLITDDVDKRHFPSWSMGFVSTNRSALKDIEGYADPSSPDFLKTNEQNQVATALKTFAQNNNISF
jgi:hypothetical protein